MTDEIANVVLQATVPDEDELVYQPVVREQTLHERVSAVTYHYVMVILKLFQPTSVQPDRGFVGSDIAELVVGKIHDLTQAVHDQAEAQ